MCEDLCFLVCPLLVLQEFLTFDMFLWLQLLIQPMLSWSCLLETLNLPNISNCFSSPYCTFKVRTVFLHSQVFIFINIELHEPFYHPGVWFTVTKCLTIISSFQWSEGLVPITSALVLANLISKVRTWLEAYSKKILHKYVFPIIFQQTLC